MKHCPACGTEYADELSACPACGTAAPSASGLLGSMGKTKFTAPPAETPAPKAEPEKEPTRAAEPAKPAPPGLVGSMGGIRAYAAPEPDAEPAPVTPPRSPAPAPAPRSYEPAPGAWSAPPERRASAPTRPAAPTGATRETAPAKRERGMSPTAEWIKYGLTLLALLAFLIVTVIVVRSDLREAKLAREGLIYSEEQARSELIAAGFRLGEGLQVDSQPGEFHYQTRLEPQEYPFLTVSGSIDFTARYSADSKLWRTSVEPKYVYDWKLDGVWYAQTEHYYVYLTVLDFDGAQLHAVLEARYDSTEGGISSCGAVEQTCTLRLEDLETEEKGAAAVKVCMTCSISGGYPEFTLILTKDAVRIFQTGDSYQATFSPVEYGEEP